MGNNDCKSLWVITDHVCRFCFGRVLKSQDGSKVRCADCCMELETEKVSKLCSCGTKYRNNNLVGMKCKKNQEHVPGTGQEITAELA